MQCRAVSFRTKPFAFDLILSGALMLFSQLPARANQSVTLTWDPSSATNVAGYKIYSGLACRTYSNVVAVGNVTSATVSGLVPGKTYYFAATTFDSAGDESKFSNETSYTVPVTAATMTSATGSGGRFSFTVSGDTGQKYVVQASTDLHDWTPVQTNTVPFTFTDTNMAGFNRRFYRACYPLP
jgi:fibronectin type 3 domain-containing protein